MAISSRQFANAKETESNHDTFRECLSDLIIQRLALPRKPPKRRSFRGRKTKIVSVEAPRDGSPRDDDIKELGDFIEYLAAETFDSLPNDLRTLTYSTVQNDITLAAKYQDPLSISTLEALLIPLPVGVVDTLTSYGLLNTSTSSLVNLLGPVLNEYIASAIAPPPPFNPTVRASACELCERYWIPLTYHHLIPKQVHAKVLKRRWHEEWRLNSVAWLCRSCHSFVHQIAGNEELAREWWSVELLRGRADVQRFAGWVSKVRWKAR